MVAVIPADARSNLVEILEIIDELLRRWIAMSLSDFGLREFFEDTKAWSRGMVTRSACSELANALTRKLGQSFVAENRPGAGGSTAAEYVAPVPDDGYVLLTANSTHSVNLYLFKSLLGG
jgi:Tripartite tricarboxylate transporter family receptor